MEVGEEGDYIPIATLSPPEWPLHEWFFFQRNWKFCGIKYELLLLKFNNLHITGAKHFNHCTLFCCSLLFLYYSLLLLSLSFWLSLSLPFSLCLNLFLSLTLSHTQQHIGFAQKLLKWKKIQPFLIFAANVTLLIHSFWEPIYKYHVQLSKLKKAQWLHDLSPSCWWQNMLQYVWSPPRLFSISSVFLYTALYILSSCYWFILLTFCCQKIIWMCKRKWNISVNWWFRSR